MNEKKNLKRQDPSAQTNKRRKFVSPPLRNEQLALGLAALVLSSVECPLANAKAKAHVENDRELFSAVERCVATAKQARAKVLS